MMKRKQGLESLGLLNGCSFQLHQNLDFSDKYIESKYN